MCSEDCEECKGNLSCNIRKLEIDEVKLRSNMGYIDDSEGCTHVSKQKMLVFY